MKSLRRKANAKRQRLSVGASHPKDESGSPSGEAEQQGGAGQQPGGVVAIAGDNEGGATGSTGGASVGEEEPAAAHLPAEATTAVTTARTAAQARANRRRELLSNAIAAVVISQGPFTAIPPILLGETLVAMPVCGEWKWALPRGGRIGNGSLIFVGGKTYGAKPMSNFVTLAKMRGVRPALLTIVLRRLGLRDRLLVPAVGTGPMAIPPPRALPFKPLTITSPAGLPVAQATPHADEEEERAHRLVEQYTDFSQ